VTYRNGTERNWGCLIATVFAAPVVILWTGIMVLSGLGSEGAAASCGGSSARFWLGVLTIAASALMLAWIINLVRRMLRGAKR
jgi:hypothetical protein